MPGQKVQILRAFRKRKGNQLTYFHFKNAAMEIIEKWHVGDESARQGMSLSEMAGKRYDARLRNIFPA